MLPVSRFAVPKTCGDLRQTLKDEIDETGANINSRQRWMWVSTFEQVKKIVKEQLGVEEDEIQMSSTFVDDLGADSLDIVELIMAFEEEFNIEIPDEKAEKIKTVEDVVKYIEDTKNDDAEGEK